MYTYSRIPVFEHNINNITGLVYAKTIFKTATQNKQMNKPLKNIMKPIYRIPENMPVYFLLDHFIKRQEHLFLVHDSYRQYTGIVTLEDALETLLGREIIDEADKIEDMQKYALEKAALWKKQIARQQNNIVNKGS